MGQNYPYGIEVDADLDKLYERAAKIGEMSSGGERRSFTSVLLAFLAADDAVSQWFQRYVVKEGIDRNAIAGTKDLAWEMSEVFRPGGPPQIDTNGKVEWSRSAREVLISGLMLAEKVGGEGGRVGLRHIMGAYCAFHFPNHEMQLRRWNFKPNAWFAAFIEFLESSKAVADADEMNRWRELTKEVSLFGRQGSALSRESLAELRRVLATLYDTDAARRLFVQDSLLDPATIDFKGDALVVWGNILAEAGKHDCIYDIVVRASKDYGGNLELAKFA